MDKSHILRILRNKGFKKTIEYLDNYPSFLSFDYVSKLFSRSKYNSPDYFYFYQGFMTVGGIMTCNPANSLNLLMAHRSSLNDSEYRDALGYLIEFIEVILNCNGVERISELILKCCGVVISQPQAKLIFLKHLLPPIKTFHGGCIGCTRQHYKGLNTCYGCCHYRGNNWDLPNEYSEELEGVKD